MDLLGGFQVSVDPCKPYENEQGNAERSREKIFDSFYVTKIIKSP